MTVWIKQGVLGDLTPPMRKCHGRLADYYEKLGLDFYVTSRRESNHSNGSCHYTGNAEDFLRQDVHLENIKSITGKDFDVIDETSHIHCEHDPK